jgi:hypothetical protein
MSEDIQKEPASPLRAEPPSAPPDAPVADDGAKPPFQWTTGAAGAIWIVAGALLFLLIPPLLYEVRTRFPYVLQGVAFPLDLAHLLVNAAVSIVAGLSGVMFVRAGIRIVRGTRPGKPGWGLGVYSLVLGLLLFVYAECLHRAASFVVALVLGKTSLTYLTGDGVARTVFNVGSISVSVLLYVAGVLALVGRSRYQRWLKGVRSGAGLTGSGATHNPLRK